LDKKELKSRNETIAFHFNLHYSVSMEIEENAPLPCCKPAGRPKASDVEARTANLIQVAGALFLAHGYSKVSLEMIAREAHVAVRTIYVKFGGKAGLFRTVIENNRDGHIGALNMDTDPRPFEEVVAHFAAHFLAMMTSPQAIRVQRMVVAEASTNPDLSQAFYEAGPRQTRDMLGRYFARPEVRARLRDDVPHEQLPVHLINCVMGDQIARFLFEPPVEAAELTERRLQERLALFYRSVLREA
jgi:TetR/AcrR family transcriptional repressor of mexJK operon